MEQDNRDLLSSDLPVIKLEGKLPGEYKAESVTKIATDLSYKGAGDEKFLFRRGDEAIKIINPAEYDPAEKAGWDLKARDELLATSLGKYLVPITQLVKANVDGEEALIGYGQPWIEHTILEELPEEKLTPELKEKLRTLHTELMQLREDEQSPLPSSHIWSTNNMGVTPEGEIVMMEYEVYDRNDEEMGFLDIWDEGMTIFREELTAMGIELSS